MIASIFFLTNTEKVWCKINYLDPDSVTHDGTILSQDGDSGYSIFLENGNEMTVQSSVISLNQNAKSSYIPKEVKDHIMHHLDDSLPLHKTNDLILQRYHILPTYC